MDLLSLGKGQQILDLGCGAGALAPSIMKNNANYTGIDLSSKLIATAKKHHLRADNRGGKSRFYVADCTQLPKEGIPGITANSFDGVTFLLSIQDINPLDGAISSAAWALKPSGKLVILMTHPCFRVPRQSGWGWDGDRKLQYRRIDRYLTPLDVPMQEYSKGNRGTTRSYHRPLQEYMDLLRDNGFMVDAIREIPAMPPKEASKETKAERVIREEIPLFLVMRAYLIN